MEVLGTFNVLNKTGVQSDVIPIFNFGALNYGEIKIFWMKLVIGIG